jgi:DNA-binding NarL/FixJ family response regulator
VESTYRFVIADDHPLFRGALREAVSGLFGDAAIAEAGSFDDAAALLDRESDVDLVLLDLTMPGVRGFSGLMYLRAQYPSVPVVVVSANDDPAVIRRCMDSAPRASSRRRSASRRCAPRSRACSKAACGRRPTSTSRPAPTARPRT